MQPISVVGVFCEDIRVEKSDIITIIGVLPDNANVVSLPSMMPKLCIYVRIHFDPNDRITSAPTILKLVDGAEVSIGDGNESIIATAKVDAKKLGAPLAEIFMRAELSPFPINTYGRIRVETQIRNKTYVACALNFKPGPP